MIPLAAIMGGAQAAIGIGQAIGGMVNMGKKKRAAEAAINAIEEKKPSKAISDVYESAKLRSTKGLGGASKQLATRGIEAGAQSAMGAAKDRKAGLALIGSTQAQRQQGALQLAGMEESALQRNQAGLTQAAGLITSEEDKALKSRQEKQSLKANVALQEVAAKRAAISQGLSAASQGLGNAASAGGSGIFGKSLESQLGQSNKKISKLLKKGPPQVGSIAPEDVPTE